MSKILTAVWVSPATKDKLKLLTIKLGKKNMDETIKELLTRK